MFRRNVFGVDLEQAPLKFIHSKRIKLKLKKI